MLPVCSAAFFLALSLDSFCTCTWFASFQRLLIYNENKQNKKTPKLSHLGMFFYFLFNEVMQDMLT